MIKRFLFIVFVLGFTVVTAQDDNSQQLLDKVSQTLSDYKNVSLTFDYSLDNESEKIHQKTSGTVNVQGEKYHLNFMGIDRISDGDKIYSIIHEDEEVYVSSVGDSEEEFSPSSILNFYKKGYRYSWDKAITQEGKKVQNIKLTPIKSGDIKYIMLGIDTKTNHIHSVSYFDNKSTKITFKIRTFKPNTPLSGKEFVFDTAKYKAKNYSITEL